MQTHEDAMLGALIRSNARRHAPPQGLAERIRSRLHESAISAQAPGAAPTRTVSRWRRFFGALAIYGAGAATAWLVASALLVAPVPGGMEVEITASHVRSLMADHLSDVRSGDRHAVKPWFAGKLDFSPPVIDLAAEGFPLAGGRLDYLNGRPAAALVYTAGSHVINLFIWPAPTSPAARNAEPSRVTEQRGYKLIHWTAAGMQVWAISDMGADELRSFADLMRTRMALADGKASAG